MEIASRLHPGLEKQGVRNEIEIASQLGTKLNDREFIIPLRLEPYEPHFRIAQLQYVDFSRSWAAGIGEVIDLLINTHKVPGREGARQSPGYPLGYGGIQLVRKTETPDLGLRLRSDKIRPTLNYCEASDRGSQSERP